MRPFEVVFFVTKEKAEEFLHSLPLEKQDCIELYDKKHDVYAVYYYL